MILIVYFVTFSVVKNRSENSRLGDYSFFTGFLALCCQEVGKNDSALGKNTQQIKQDNV